MNALSRPMLATSTLAVGMMVGWFVRGVGDSGSSRQAGNQIPASLKEAPGNLSQVITTLVNDESLADGPRLSYFEFVTRTAALSPEESVQALNDLVTAGLKSKIDYGLNAGLSCLLQRLAVARPALAGDWLVAHHQVVEDEIMERVGKMIIEKEPSVIAQLKAKVTDETVLEYLHKLEIQHMAQANPAAAVEAALTSPAADSLLEIAMAKWQRQDPAASFNWVVAQPAARLAQVCAARFETCSTADVDRLTQLIPTWTDPGGTEALWRPVSSRVVGQMIGEAGIEATQVWLGKLTPSPLKLAAKQDFCAQWLRSDAVAASQWIAGLPSSPEREASVQVLITSILDTDPERAFGWAKQLHDDHGRQAAMRQAMQQWLKSNPLAAAKALEQTEPEFRESF